MNDALLILYLITGLSSVVERRVSVVVWQVVVDALQVLQEVEHVHGAVRADVAHGRLENTALEIGVSFPTRLRHAKKRN